MGIDENTRLDLRRAFEDLLGPELAGAAMEAMPNIEYTDLATRADLRNELANLRVEIDSDLLDLKRAIADLRNEMASNLRITVLSQIGTAIALVGFVSQVG